MYLTKRTNKKVIVSAVLVMLMVFAMMPGMAFADDSISIDSGDTTVFTGSQTTFSVTPAPDDITSHIDWSSSDTGVASISTHNGILTVKTTGVVTITAKLVEGERPSGTGGGSGGSCTGAVLAQDSVEVTILESQDYGLQGDGDNALKLVSPPNVKVNKISTRLVGDRLYNVYENTIQSEVELDSGGKATFGYTLSAGVNNFNVDSFDNYKHEIKVFAGKNDINSNIVFDRFDSTSKTIYFTADGLDFDEGYVLEFGPNVCGNNASRITDCFIQFEFNTEQ